MATITVYSKQTCPFCVAAKEKLDRWGFEYTEVEVDKDEQAMEFIKSRGHRTVPQIYINNKTYVPDGCSGLTVIGKEGVEKLIAITEEES